MLNEAEVLDACMAFLTGGGWTVESFSRPTQRGVDITAARGSDRLEVEVKGSTSSKPRSKGYGKPMAGSEVRVHVAEAVYTARVALDRPDAARQAVGFPDDPLHRRYAEPIRWLLSEHDVALLWVDGDRGVSVDPAAGRLLDSA